LLSTATQWDNIEKIGPDLSGTPWQDKKNQTHAGTWEILTCIRFFYPEGGQTPEQVLREAVNSPPLGIFKTQLPPEQLGLTRSALSRRLNCRPLEVPSNWTDSMLVLKEVRYYVYFSNLMRHPRACDLS